MQRVQLQHGSRIRLRHPEGNHLPAVSYTAGIMYRPRAGEGTLV